MPQRYTLENIKKVLKKPGYVGWEAQRILFDLRHRNDAVNVMERDWDNLILLDACRYDYFADQNPISGKLNSIISHGGQSWEFMQGNFVGEQFHDTVYVTANPHTGKLDDDVFHAVEPLHLNSWSDTHQTVLPSDVNEAAIAYHEQYPNKRLIVHYMQPHRPYLGETAEELQRDHNISGYNRHLAHSDTSPDTPTFSTLIKKGEISIEKTARAYRETLDIVLEYAQKLVDQLSGRSVVSADHGEMLGEKIIPFTTPKYGHSHEYIRNETLYKVPWLIVPANERRKLVADDPLGFERGSHEIVEDRLQSLGYK